jgi:hypothetical protein
MMMPGLIVLTRAPRLPQRTASAHHAQRVAALGELVCVQRVHHLVGLEERKVEQLLHGRRRQRVVLLDGERRQTVPGCEAMTPPNPQKR